MSRRHNPKITPEIRESVHAQSMENIRAYWRSLRSSWGRQGSHSITEVDYGEGYDPLFTVQRGENRLAFNLGDGCRRTMPRRYR